MRIFRWNPKTGRYGEELKQVTLASWTGQSLAYAVGEGLVAPIEHAAPTGFSKTSNVTVHIDAGRTTAEGDVSYIHDREWICFCLGEMIAGEDSAWEWVILPPRGLIRKVKDIAYDPQPGDDEPMVTAFLDAEQDAAAARWEARTEAANR